MNRRNDRAAFVAGLRELAHFLNENPDVPVPPFTTSIIYFPDGDDLQERAEVDRIAQLLGVEPTGEATAHYKAVRSFGPIEYEAVAILDDEMRRHKALMSYSDLVQPEDGGQA